MGQQQLLLLVLGILFVALTSGCDTNNPSTPSEDLAGVYAFAENPKKANARALLSDVVRIASDAQAWSLRHATYRGGGASFEGLTFDQIGYRATAGVYRNVNGRFKLSSISAASISIVACDEQPTFDNLVVADVTGTKPTDIHTEVVTAECIF